jgi:hypothetical protein
MLLGFIMLFRPKLLLGFKTGILEQQQFLLLFVGTQTWILLLLLTYYWKKPAFAFFLGVYFLKQE